MSPSMVEAQRAHDDEIPFGIRALESGVEVTGVWISQSNTPAPSSPNSLRGSVMSSDTSSLLNEAGTSLPPPMSEASQEFRISRPARPPGPQAWSNKRPRPRSRSEDGYTALHSHSHSHHSRNSSRSRRISLPSASNLRYSITMDSLEDGGGLPDDTTRRGEQACSLIVCCRIAHIKFQSPLQAKIQEAWMPL